jgi:hypothetical protein
MACHRVALSCKAKLSRYRAVRTLARNSTYNKYVLVFGRRTEYAGNEDRRRLVKAVEHDDFKIITFDSLAEDISGKYELTVGSRHNQFIDILTDEITKPRHHSCRRPA